jgi:hypothetical protein
VKKLLKKPEWTTTRGENEDTSSSVENPTGSTTMAKF